MQNYSNSSRIQHGGFCPRFYNSKDIEIHPLCKKNVFEDFPQDIEDQFEDNLEVLFWRSVLYEKKSVVVVVVVVGFISV